MPPATPETFGNDDLLDETIQDRVAAEKARALREPGSSWRTWALHSLLRWYYMLGILIVDVQIIVFWYQEGSVVGLVATLVAATYLELLLYRLLWYRPRVDAPRHAQFHRTWLRPVEYGRWTPEAQLVEAGVEIYDDTTEGPNPKEFL